MKGKWTEGRQSKKCIYTFQVGDVHGMYIVLPFHPEGISTMRSKTIIAPWVWITVHRSSISFRGDICLIWIDRHKYCRRQVECHRFIINCSQSKRPFSSQREGSLMRSTCSTRIEGDEPAVTPVSADFVFLLPFFRLVSLRWPCTRERATSIGEERSANKHAYSHPFSPSLGAPVVPLWRRRSQDYF